jgi:hypothetical protein
MKSIQTIIVISLSTRALDLGPGMDRTCRLSKILSQIGPLQAVQMLKDCMSYGRELMSKFLGVYLVEVINPGYVSPYPTPSMGLLEELKIF